MRFHNSKVRGNRFLVSKMKRIALAGMIFGFMAGPVLADEFKGPLYVSSVSAGCAGFPRVGDIFGMRYLPRNLGTNGDTTILTFSGGTSPSSFAISLRADGVSLIGTAFRPVEGDAIFERHGAFQSEMRITSQVPNAPTTSTQSITLRGNIRDLTGPADNCDVAFQATGYDFP